MKHESLRYFVTLSALCAIVFVLGLTPLGIIPIGIINVTILCIPVIIGTLLFGYKGGLILGACFGLASTLRAFGIPTPPSALVATLMAENPLYVILMSMLPRLCVPLSAFGAYKLISRAGKSDGSRCPQTLLHTIAGSTLFIILFPLVFIALYAFSLVPFAVVLAAFVSFMGFELIFAGAGENTVLIICSVAGSLTNTVLYLGLMLLFYTLSGLGGSKILALIKDTGIIGGGLEAMAAAILIPPIVKALKAAKLGF